MKSWMPDDAARTVSDEEILKAAWHEVKRFEQAMHDLARS